MLLQDLERGDSPSHQSRTWWLVPIVLLLGFGAHASSHALAPAEPVIEANGISPIAYSVLTLVPTVGQLLTPALWGNLFTVNARRALICAPLGLLIGQICLAIGLMLHEWKCSFYLMGSFFAVGSLLFTGCKAGIAVLVHSALACVLPKGLTSGFCLNVACTHLFGACVSFTLPHILANHGLVGVQCGLLIPALISVLAACFLAARVPPAPPPPAPPPTPKRASVGRDIFVVLCTSCGRELKIDKPYQTACEPCSAQEEARDQARQAVLLLSAWRACTVGLLHGFVGVTSGLLVSHGLTLREAGGLNAAYSGVALLVLVPLPALASRVGLRPLLIAVSAVGTAAAALLLATQQMGDADPWAAGRPGHRPLLLMAGGAADAALGGGGTGRALAEETAALLRGSPGDALYGGGASFAGGSGGASFAGGSGGASFAGGSGGASLPSVAATDDAVLQLVAVAAISISRGISRGLSGVGGLTGVGGGVRDAVGGGVRDAVRALRGRLLGQAGAPAPRDGDEGGDDQGGVGALGGGGSQGGEGGHAGGVAQGGRLESSDSPESDANRTLPDHGPIAAPAPMVEPWAVEGAPDGDVAQNSTFYLSRAALFGLTLAGTAAPVLPLALIPANAPLSAYGYIDSLSYAGQALATLALGGAREAGGFESAIQLLVIGLAMGALVANMAMHGVVEPPSP